jgi:STE24 endopeptidase
MSITPQNLLYIFAGFYIVHITWLTILDVLNLKHSRKQLNLPESLKERFSEEYQEKSLAYQKDKTRFGIISRFAMVPFFWFLILMNGFNAFDHYAIQIAGQGTIWHSVAYCLLIGLYFSVISLPLSFYSTFVIEEKHGFNKTTVGLFIADLIKGAVLSLALGVPLLYGIFSIIETFPKDWWIWAWIFLTGFQLFITAVYPTFLAPLFNKFEPLQNQELENRIKALADKIGFKMSGVFTMDGSRRSTHGNAYFAGLGKFRRIVLFDTLLNDLTEDELLGVLAHEMGHNVKNHVLKNLITSTLMSGVGLYLLYLLSQWAVFYEAFGVMIPSAHTALVVFMLTSDIVFFFLTPVMNGISRKYEYEADAFAVETTNDGNGLKAALLKLTETNLGTLNPHPLYSFFHYSHPTTLERVRAIDNI